MARQTTPTVLVPRLQPRNALDGGSCLLRATHEAGASEAVRSWAGALEREHQLVTSTKTAGTSEAYVYDKTGNRIVGSTVVGKGNRILNDGTYAFLYDGNGNLTRRTTLVSGAPTGAYVQYAWDHRNQLTKVEFFNAPVNGTATLAKTVAYTYDDSSNRINKTLTVPGQAVVAENYVYDGDQLVAVMNATGAIQHEYFSGSALDQVFADQTVLSGVLWPMSPSRSAVMSQGSHM